MSHRIPVTYVLFSDEGHVFARPENSKAYAVAEGFLGIRVGGRVQPIGAGGVAGLAEAMKTHRRSRKIAGNLAAWNAA